MQVQIASIKQDKTKWGLTAAACAIALVAAFSFTRPAGAATATLVVDDDGQATANNCNSSTATPYTTIGAAITAANANDTVKVCPGAYAENVVVDKALTLKGAKAGEWVNSRTFGAANESTITGLVTIQAADVKVEGFSLTNPNQGLGVVVKTAANNATIKKNILKTVGSNTFVGPTVGVYLELGPDDVNVAGNKISEVQSQTGSAQGVLVGDSTSANPSLDTTIDNNTISDITSVSRGAYGVQVNNGASTAPSATGYTEASIHGNSIKTLSGNWAHAIGLEGETPNVVVTHNVVSGLTDNNPVPAADTIGVFFEDNPFFFTGEVNNNSLNVTTTGYGIAVSAALTTQYPSLSVDGECNWWGAANGPGAVATGSGSLVTAGVDYKPWLKSANLNKDCDDHNHSKHGGDWKDHNNDDWWRNND
ncbi:MAG TPA: hypothetical protein VMY99_02390 [Nevskiaceae bacterium]|nr:hypothetical protein [Nevskiaceae bacterium]